MTLDELPDDFTPEQFMALPRTELDRVSFTPRRWCCHWLGCDRSTGIRDYGLEPWFWTRWGWHDFGRAGWFLCGKHYPMYRRLIKSNDPALVAQIKFKEGLPLQHFKNANT